MTDAEHIAQMEKDLQAEQNPHIRVAIELQLMIGLVFYPWLTQRLDAIAAGDESNELRAATMNAVTTTAAMIYAAAVGNTMQRTPEAAQYAIGKFAGTFAAALGLHIESDHDDDGPNPAPEAPKPN